MTTLALSWLVHRISLMQLSKIEKRLNLYALRFSANGGGERVRTDGLLRARQALSQLSYTPVIWWAREDSNLRPHDYQSCALAS